MIFNIQRFSIHDGPGIRTTVFLKGCPLACMWCANPESQSFEYEVAHSDLRCNGCKDCLQACPNNAIIINSKDNKKIIRIDRNLCSKCLQCVEVCYTGAIKLYGYKMTVKEVFEKVEKDIPFYTNSNGGVTVSGGEPLCQTKFVTELFKICKEIGIHTTLDTCGYANKDSFKKVLPYTDLVLYDLKFIDEQEHEKYTGKKNNLISNNLYFINSYVKSSNLQMIIRVPIIPGINDSKKNIIDIIAYIKKLDKTIKIEILPYHRLGISKYSMLDREYKLNQVKTCTKKRILDIKKIFNQHNLDCIVRV